MALPRSKRMVVHEDFEIETASYWNASPKIAAGKLRPEEIPPRSFLLPAAMPVKKKTPMRIPVAG
jgi:hypothetical protein